MRNRNESLIVLGRLLTSYGYYMVIPFLAVYVTKYLGMSAIQAGILLAVLNIGRRGLGILAGYWSDRFGHRRMMLVGLGLEVLAYATFGIATNFYALLLITFLSGAGGCLYNISSRSILAAAKSTARVATNFSLFYVTMHIGALIGPLTYAWFVATGHIHLTFALAAVAYALFVLITLRWLQPDSQEQVSQRTIQARDLVQVFKSRPFMLYCLLITGSWAVLNQLYVGLPLHATQQGFSDQIVAYLNSFNAALVILLQYGCGRWVERLQSGARLQLLMAGTALMAGGFAVCAVAGLTPLFVATGIFTLGEILFVGVVDVLATQFAPSGQSGLYLGFSTVTWALGGSLGSFLGGLGYTWGVQHAAIGLFWAGLLAFGLVVALGIWASKSLLGRTLAEATQSRVA